MSGQVEVASSLRPLFTIETLAEHLSLSESAVRGLISRREIPCLRIGLGRLVRVRPEDVDDYVREGKASDKGCVKSPPGPPPQRIASAPRNVADIRWHRQKVEREQAHDRYHEMLMSEPGNWHRHDEVAAVLGLSVAQIKYLMRSGLPHLKVRGVYLSRPCTARAWLREFEPNFIPLAERREAIPADVRREVYKRDGRRCKHCGATRHLSLDHIYPWSLGGSDRAENLQTLCRSCNSSKGAKV
jgi:excisionase family DNA binding protein